MNDLLQKLEEKINETERIALDAGGQSWAAGSLEWTEETGWVFHEEESSVVRVVEDPDTTIVHAFDVVRADRGYRTPSIQQAAHIAHNDPKRVLRRVARDRKLLELAKVLREDYQDNAADHLIRLVAEDYEIEVES